MFHELEGKPLIQYPCTWEFRTIGPDEELMRAAIAEVLGACPYTIAAANVSSQGKYRSLVVSLEVQSEEHRHQIFSGLSEHRDIRYVI